VLPWVLKPSATKSITLLSLPPGLCAQVLCGSERQVAPVKALWLRHLSLLPFQGRLRRCGLLPLPLLRIRWVCGTQSGGADPSFALFDCLPPCLRRVESLAFWRRTPP
jgi:hypothetical protein